MEEGGKEIQQTGRKMEVSGPRLNSAPRTEPGTAWQPSSLAVESPVSVRIVSSSGVAWRGVAGHGSAAQGRAGQGRAGPGGGLCGGIFMTADREEINKINKYWSQDGGEREIGCPIGLLGTPAESGLWELYRCKLPRPAAWKGRL